MATRNLGSLTIDLVARTGGFERGMDRAARTADSRMRHIQRQAKIVGAAIGTAVAGIGSALAATIHRSVTNMAEISRMADQIGVATENLTAMRYAAEQLAGVSSGQFDMALRRMTRRIAEAADGGGPAAKAIESMGLSARELAKLAPDEQFRRIADAIKATGDQGTRLRHVMALMDTEGMPLVNMLSAGADEIARFEEEADKLGVTFDGHAGRSAVEFERNMDRLKTAVDGVWRAVATDLVPDLERMTNQFSAAYIEGDRLKETADDIAEAIRGLATATKFVVDGFRVFGHVAAGAWSAMTPWVDGMENWRKARDIGQGMFGGGGATPRTVNVALAGVDPVPAGLFRPPRGPTPDADGATGGKGSSDAIKAMQDMLREQQRLADAQQSWTDRLLDAQAALMGPVAEAHRQHEKRMTDLTRAYDDGEVKLADFVQMQEVYQEQLDKTLKAIEAQRTPAQRMLEDLEFEKELLRLSNEEREVAIALRWANVDAMSAEGKELAEAARNLHRTREAYSDLIEAQDAVRDAGANFLTDWTTGAKSFKDAMIDALDSIHRRLTQMIAENLMDQLLGQRGQDGGGTYGNWISAIFSGMFGGGKASGGWAMPNTVYQVNERGLEMATVGGKDYMLTGNQPVHVTPNHRLGGEPGLTVNNQFHLAAPTSHKTQHQIAVRAAFELNRARRKM